MSIWAVHVTDQRIYNYHFWKSKHLKGVRIDDIVCVMETDSLRATVLSKNKGMSLLALHA